MELTFGDFVKFFIMMVVASFIASVVTSFRDAHIKKDSVVIVEKQTYRIINVETSDNKIVLDVYKIGE